MRRTITAAALLALTLGGAAAASGIASAETGTDSTAAGRSDGPLGGLSGNGLPIIGNLGGNGGLLGNLGNGGSGKLPVLGDLV